MEGISYNRSEASRITDDIGIAVGNVNDYMLEEYIHLKHTFQDNWVGPDEVAFMNKYLVALKDVFRNVMIVGETMSNFVVEAALTMVNFQNQVSSELEGSISISQEIENKFANSGKKMNFLDYCNVQSMDFDPSQQLGLVTANSETVLVEALDTYTSGVQTKIKESIGAVEVGNAFVSSENANMGIKAFIDNVAESMQNLTKIVDSFKNETIPQLVAAFKSQASQISDDSSTAASNIGSQING